MYLRVTDPWILCAIIKGNRFWVMRWILILILQYSGLGFLIVCIWFSSRKGNLGDMLKGIGDKTNDDNDSRIDRSKGLETSRIRKRTLIDKTTLKIMKT